MTAKYFWSSIGVATVVVVYFLYKCSGTGTSNKPSRPASSKEKPEDTVPKTTSKDLSATSGSTTEKPVTVPENGQSSVAAAIPASAAPPTSTAMFVQCAHTLLRSGISAVNQNDGRLTHAYYQQNDGSISVIYKDGALDSNPGWGGGDNVTVLAAGKATMKTPLTTIQWNQNGGSEYRTYYLNQSLQICENVLSPRDGGKWHDGAMNIAGATAAPYTKLSAIVWVHDNAPHIRVYYQGVDDKIHELVYEPSSGWSQGATLPGTPLHGTSLSFVQRSKSPTPSIRGYYQESDRTLMEVCWDSGWSLGTHIGRSAGAIPYRTAITATVPSAPEFIEQWIRVYFLDERNQLVEYYWHYGWHGPAVLPFSSNVNVPCAQMVAVSFMRGDFNAQPDVRIYVQQPYCIWNEVACVKGTWGGSQGLNGVGIRTIPIS